MDHLISIRDLHTYFYQDEGVVRAVEGVNLDIPRGKTLCVVGESGCGKSITALSILRLITSPGKIIKGKILYDRNGQTLDLAQLAADGRLIRDIRGAEIAMIFQEPMTSLSPVHTVGFQIMEAVRLHTDLSRAEAKERTLSAMKAVGLPEVYSTFKQYPHELSGGLRQRIMIAMALSCNPKMLIADEPTTALDVTLQAQILKLMRKAQEMTKTSIMFITHDFSVVAEMADEVAVMYLGKVVEQGDTKRIFLNPLHPYTIALMESIPGMKTPPKSRLAAISGSVPSPYTRLPGCPFHPRCREMQPELCDVGERPALLEIEPGHKTACLLRHKKKGEQSQ